MSRGFDFKPDRQVAVIADANVAAILRRAVGRGLVLQREERPWERDLSRERPGVPAALRGFFVKREQRDVGQHVQAVPRVFIRRVHDELQLAKNLERRGDRFPGSARDERRNGGAHHLLTPPIRSAVFFLANRPVRQRGVVGNQKREVRQEVFGRVREQRPAQRGGVLVRALRSRGFDSDGAAANARHDRGECFLRGLSDFPLRPPSHQRDRRGVRLVQPVRHDAVLQLGDHRLRRLLRDERHGDEQLRRHRRVVESGHHERRLGRRDPEVRAVRAHAASRGIRLREHLAHHVEHALHVFGGFRVSSRAGAAPFRKRLESARLHLRGRAHGRPGARRVLG